MNVLDPWLDAATIAASLQQRSASLVVLLGAESWCAKCRELRPVFEAAAANATAGAWLWLDLEEHAEFIGDFVPDDMPLLLVYFEGKLLHSAIASQSELDVVLHGRGEATVMHSAPPELLERLLDENWVLNR